MIIGTIESRALCKKIAKLTDTVVMGYSRGKDTLAAVVWLKEFFPRLILFYDDACPGLGIAERSLAEMEQRFGVTIERTVCQSLFESLGSMIYQPIEDEELIDGMRFNEYPMSRDRTAELIRDKYDVGHAWIAWGISREDSIVRKSQKKYREGINEAKRVFYPCFDWRRENVLQAITSSNLNLPEDYLLSSRSFASPLNPRGLLRMKEKFPEDFERVKFFYPFIEAALARNEFRRNHGKP